MDDSGARPAGTVRFERVRVTRFLSSLAVAVLASRPVLAQPARECATVPPARTASLDSAQQARGDRLWWPAVEACGPHRIVASLPAPERDHPEDFGARVVLLRPTGGHDLTAFAAVSFSRGFLESTSPRLRAFSAGGRVLVLADLGDEGGSWGIEAFEVIQDSLRALGRLEVGKGSRDDENDGSAFQHLSVALRSRRWEVSFDTVVVLRPNRDSRAVVYADPHRPVRFRAADGTWSRVR